MAAPDRRDPAGLTSHRVGAAVTPTTSGRCSMSPATQAVEHFGDHELERPTRAPTIRSRAGSRWLQRSIASAADTSPRRSTRAPTRTRARHRRGARTARRRTHRARAGRSAAPSMAGDRGRCGRHRSIATSCMKLTSARSGSATACSSIERGAAESPAGAGHVEGGRGGDSAARASTAGDRTATRQHRSAGRRRGGRQWRPRAARRLGMSANMDPSRRTMRAFTMTEPLLVRRDRSVAGGYHGTIRPVPPKVESARRSGRG